MPVRLGRVLVSSGWCSRVHLWKENAKRKTKVQGWALIELSPETFNHKNENYFVTMPRLHDPDMSFNLVNNAPGVVLCSAGDTLPGQFGPLAGGKWYFKMGRSTNITSGIRNRALVYVNWAAEEHIDDFGRVCGLVHGSAVSLCSRGFCSSMEDTRQWVKEKIPGVSVSLPVPPGWA